MENRTLQKKLEKLALDLGAAVFGVAGVKDIKKEFHFSDVMLDQQHTRILRKSKFFF